MKRIFSMIMLLILLSTCARAEYWNPADLQPAVCCDSRPGCQVLQTVMMGSFAQFDPDDSLNVRVLSAALPRLTAVTEDDFAHFNDFFNTDPDTVKELYYIALGNCLRSDIIVTPLVDSMDEQNARIVLDLFLNPGSEADEEQMRAIRDNCTEDTIRILAESAGVPVGFAEHLLAEPETE